MSVLDQVIDLQNKGVTDNEIVGILKEQGISPKAINDALSQAQIKSAVSSEGQSNSEEMEPSIMVPDRAESLPTEGTPFDVEDLAAPIPSKFAMTGIYPGGPATREMSDYVPRQQAAYSQYSPYQYQSQEQEGYQQDAYQAAESGFSGADTMIEIAEQVFSEKVRSMQKHMDELTEFRAMTQTKVDNVSERLRRIESAIDRLQSAILERVGSYTSGIDSVKKEMSMMQESFGKVVSTLADKSEHKHHSQHHHPQTSHTAPTVHRIEKRTTVVHRSHKTAPAKKHHKKK